MDRWTYPKGRLVVCVLDEERAWRSLAAARLRFEQSLERLTSTLQTAGRDLERARDEYQSFLTAARRAEGPLVASTPLVPLTDRERKIAMLAAIGRSDAEVARSAHISVYTVKSHMKSILRKLVLRSRWQLPYALGNLSHATVSPRSPAARSAQVLRSAARPPSEELSGSARRSG